MTNVDPEKWLTTKEILDLQEDGRQAALSGEHPRTCPHQRAQYPADQARRQMWNRGFAAGRTERRE